MIFFRLEKEHEMLNIGIGELLTKKELEKINMKRGYFSAVEVAKKRTTISYGMRLMNYGELKVKELLRLNGCNLKYSQFRELEKNPLIASCDRFDGYKYRITLYEDDYKIDINIFEFMEKYLK